MVFDGELRLLLMDGTWHPRRFALTKDVIFLLHPDSERIIDAIPLFELEDATFMQEASKEAGAKTESVSTRRESVESKLETIDGNASDVKEKKSGKSNKILFNHAFQLRTSPEGYNSGRQYIIQAHSDAECHSLVELIIGSAKVATEKFLAKSRFLKAQA